MKILEISRSYYPSFGGLEMFISDRLGMYAELGYEFQLVSTDFNIKDIKDSDTNNNVKVIPQFTPYNITPSIKEYLSKEYDIISVNQVGRYFSDYSVRWGKKNKIPTIITPHFFYHTRKNTLMKKLISRFVIKDTLRLANSIICFTKTEKEFWCNFDSEIENKIITIPHFYRALPIFEEDIKDDGYLLYIGRYDENKKIELLLNSFLSLQSTHMKLFLTLDITQLPSRFGRFRNNTNIKFLGHVTELKKTTLLKNCTALILPSDYEAFGITLLEASNFYKPLLASNLSVFHDIHDPKGIIYFENNLESLTNALMRLFNLSVEEKFEMGKSNFNNLQLYDYKIISEQYKSLYQSIVKKIY